jgi:molybdenum cofactor cytidylyltransferase
LEGSFEIDFRQRKIAGAVEVIAGIILAAGASSRMGTPKALLDYRGETFLDRLIRVLGTVCDPVIVALGYHADEIRAKTRPAKFVVNPDPSRGQLSSLQSALAAVPDDAEGFLFLPVDCPAPEPETIRQIVDAFHSTNSLLVIPRHEGRRGHPVCASRALLAEFLALPPTAQAKEVVRRHPAHYLETSDPGVLSDIDDPESYRALVGRAISLQPPSKAAPRENSK